MIPRASFSSPAEAAAKIDLGPLPSWDLKDLYKGQDDPALAADLDWAERQAKSLAERYETKMVTLDGVALAAALRQYEQMHERLGRAGSYASLLFAGDMNDPAIAKFRTDLFDRLNDITRHTVFFELEINKIADEDLARALKEPTLARYKPWLDRVRQFRPHQLSDELERFLHDQSVTGRGAWIRLFDETLAAMTVTVRGETYNCEGALHLLMSPDARLRADAGEALAHTFKDNIRSIALVTNVLAKDKEVEDRWRKLPTPATSRHLANEVEPEVVEALVTAVRAHYPKLSHRYYALKARWLGKDKLEAWDRNAPLPDAALPDVPWEEAKHTVLTAYRAFSPKLAEVGERFFHAPWIDAPLRNGKAPGAFAHPTVPSAHPYLLLNYQGHVRDVMTLAHELGHGVHQVLAARQGYFLSDTPLTLAETASVFGEMLTFQSILKATTDRKARRALLASKVEDMINTVVRQIAFHCFETEVHARRREGELTAEDLGKIWLKVQGESLGPAIRLNDGYETFWCYISHFIHSPFYVYAYAFGDGLVNALYARYEEAHEGFAERYLELLSAGGTLRHKALLAPFGLDATDPAFWSLGLKRIESMIDELEALSS